MDNYQEKKKIKWWQLILGIVLLIGIPIPILYNMSSQPKEDTPANTFNEAPKYQTYYRITVKHARVYLYMQDTDGSSYMMSMDRFYDYGATVKGEIVHLEGQGNYLKIKWGDDLTQMGYLQLSDVEEDYKEAY